jgi:hypothetical protein
MTLLPFGIFLFYPHYFSPIVPASAPIGSNAMAETLMPVGNLAFNPVKQIIRLEIACMENCFFQQEI